jgi:cell wall assembly regulator SMI1
MTTVAPSIAQSWQRIHGWLASNAPRILTNLNPGASDDMLRETERGLGVEMPEEWRQLYRQHNGMNAEGNTGSLFYGMQFMPLKRVLDEQANASTPASEKMPVRAADKGVRTHDMHNPKWIGLAHDFGETQLRIDCDPAPGGLHGQVIFTDHADDTAILVAPSVTDLLWHLQMTCRRGFIISIKKRWPRETSPSHACLKLTL